MTAGAVIGATVGFAACTAPSTRASPLVTPAAARAAVVRHWDVNREALRATSAASARRLIQSVEAGDALKMDEMTIAAEAQARGTGGTPGPNLPEATGIRVFVPRQAAYPAVFVSIRDDAQTDRAGKPTGKTVQVLEAFRRTSASDAWRNTGYAQLGEGLSSKLDVTVDGDGYAAFGGSSPTQSELSTLYTTYMTAALAGHTDPSAKAVQPGPFTDQFATELRTALASTPSVSAKATFSASSEAGGISLRTKGGSFVLFSALYDVTSTPAAGGCVTAGPGSATPGSFSSVTEHFRQNAGALVTGGSGAPVVVIAESDGPVSVETRPCAGGGTVV